ncbi:MAG: hypothetical protein FWC20_04480, partial [Oscillospiraceae bacterium]|nr:hypothetical protein [Oscillospiraceae bacterium]
MKIIPYDSINKTRRGMRVMSRELLYQRGSDSLSDTGLLEVIINTGATNNSVNQISKNINAVMQKYGIECVTAKDFLSIKGIGKARAAMLMASIEYFRRLYTKPTAPLIDTPEKAFEQLAHIKNKKQEHFVLLTLDGARRLISNRIVTIGTMMASLVHPREVFAYAIEDRAASIIVAH